MWENSFVTKTFLGAHKALLKAGLFPKNEVVSGLIIVWCGGDGDGFRKSGVHRKY